MMGFERFLAILLLLFCASVFAQSNDSLIINTSILHLGDSCYRASVFLRNDSSGIRPNVFASGIEDGQKLPFTMDRINESDEIIQFYRIVCVNNDTNLTIQAQKENESGEKTVQLLGKKKPAAQAEGAKIAEAGKNYSLANQEETKKRQAELEMMVIAAEGLAVLACSITILLVIAILAYKYALKKDTKDTPPKPPMNSHPQDD